MSTWIKVKPDDINVNFEDETVEVLYSSDDNGNNYIEIPLEVLQDKIDVLVKAKAQELIERLSNE